MGKIVGKFLKQCRKNKNLTLRYVEDQSGISNGYLSQVERGERNTPTIKILFRLASIYDCHLYDIVCEAVRELENETIKTKRMPGLRERPAR